MDSFELFVPPFVVPPMSNFVQFCLTPLDFRTSEKKIGGSGITPSYFPALMNMTIFGHILKVLRCSNNLVQKMTSITPYIYETIHKKVFFKNFDQKF